MIYSANLVGGWGARRAGKMGGEIYAFSAKTEIKSSLLT
jgi:hypothetical protein